MSSTDKRNDIVTYTSPEDVLKTPPVLFMEKPLSVSNRAFYVRGLSDIKDFRLVHSNGPELCFIQPEVDEEKENHSISHDW